jgi:GPH family glycoside/pentoside/hexuronide:cation symporter
LCAASFLVVWWFPAGQSDAFYFGWLLGASLLFYLAFTIFSVPYSALGMELSPDYHERTSVITFRTVIEQLGFFVVASLFFLTSLDCFPDRADGMRWNSLWVAGLIFAAILAPALFSREHSGVAARLQTGCDLKDMQKVPLFRSIKETLSCRPFLSLALITIFSYPAVVTVGALGYYLTIYYVFDGDKGPASGALMTVVGYSMPFAVMLAIPLMGGLSKKIGKRNALIASFSLCTLGCVLRWPLITPASPYLSVIPTVLFGIGAAAAYLFINAMIPDAVDADELKTGERREGMFSAAYGWTYKLGAALAMWLSGFVLNWTGFDVSLERQTPETIFWLRFSFTWVAAIFLLLTLLLVFTYSITEARAYEIRQRLIETRRKKGVPSFL